MFKKNQLVVALNGWGTYNPCLVIINSISYGGWHSCLSVGFRKKQYLFEMMRPVGLEFHTEDLRNATFKDIMEIQFFHKESMPHIKDFLKSLVK